MSVPIILTIATVATDASAGLWALDRRLAHFFGLYVHPLHDALDDDGEADGFSHGEIE